MIKKLKNKIFMILFTSLTIVVLGIILIFASLNCNSAIRTSRMNIDRVTRMQERPEFRGEQDKSVIDEFIREQNEKANSQVKKIIIFAIVIALISLIIIYLVSKKIADIIVKPVNETLEKQKQFISDASHELKTPLAVIEANSDVLENEIGNNKWLTYIQNEAESMDKLINELLLLAKIENVDNVKDYEKFNLSEYIETITSMFESMAYEKQVKIITKIQNNIILNGNKQDIEHIVSTLLDNAIKHSLNEKDVEVELLQEKNNVIINVRNCGEPIPKNQQDRIFERFYRVDKARNRDEKRYGLGLAIAKSTVIKYNGKIDVECKEGITCFKVSLPI